MSVAEISTVPQPVVGRRRPRSGPGRSADFEEAGLNFAQVESLILKFLLNIGVASGRRIAEELGLPVRALPRIPPPAQEPADRRLHQLGDGQRLPLLADRRRPGAGQDLLRGVLLRRRRPRCRSTTTSSRSPRRRSPAEHPKEEDLRRAFSDLLISEEMFDVLGPAINSGRGMFLYGYPGNGKTSIAERITRCFGSTIWIPKVIDVEGQILKLFDPANHEPIVTHRSGLLRDDDYDHRWIEIRRPTIIAGGELRMEDLEIHYDPITKISEAPLQLKSNNGTFLIDDFGRQRMAPIELLNRWIVPLEKRYDFLCLANGKKIRVPFDQLILFSTNLEPKQLVDEAFLRRIPYKINADRPDRGDVPPDVRRSSPPSSASTDVDHDVARLPDRPAITAGVNRPFRCCQPRDLLLQVRNYCVYNDLPLELKPEYFDFAASNYFTVM